MNSEIEQRNIKLSYLNVFDIYVIDYAGTITFDKGLSNMDIIEDELIKLSFNRDCLKIIFDLSNTVWENQDTHDALSKIARKILTLIILILRFILHLLLPSFRPLVNKYKLSFMIM